MSFLQSLARSFIRSSVRQVGRDVGRMVSNQTLRGRHATPHTYIPREEVIPSKSQPAPQPTSQPAPQPSAGLPDPSADRVGDPDLWLTPLERNVLHQAGSHLLAGYDRSLADQGAPAAFRTLQEDELYAYAAQIAANADNSIDSGEVDLSIVLTNLATGADSQSSGGEQILRRVSGMLKEDITGGQHPIPIFRRNLLRFSRPVQLNAIRLMAKVILQDGRLENQEKLWLFEVIGYAGIRLEEL